MGFTTGGGIPSQPLLLQQIRSTHSYLKCSFLFTGLLLIPSKMQLSFLQQPPWLRWLAFRFHTILGTDLSPLYCVCVCVILLKLGSQTLRHQLTFQGLKGQLSRFLFPTYPEWAEDCTTSSPRTPALYLRPKSQENPHLRRMGRQCPYLRPVTSGREVLQLSPLSARDSQTRIRKVGGRAESALADSAAAQPSPQQAPPASSPKAGGGGDRIWGWGRGMDGGRRKRTTCRVRGSFWRVYTWLGSSQLFNFQTCFVRNSVSLYDKSTKIVPSWDDIYMFANRML